MSTEDHPDWWRPTGGQNSQDSILERRSLIWNDNGVVNGVDPPAFYTCETLKGKFYPRGCRGMIEEIQIYCRDAGADLLTLRYCPHPGYGPFNEVTITPLAGWSWVAAVIGEMWNYDSLFIWVVECEAGTDWAYDAVLPYDGHGTVSWGQPWPSLAIRPFIRVVYTGETPGDVPVSGIVNNIRIPSTGAEIALGAFINVPHNDVTFITDFDGSGTLIQATIHIRDDNLATPTNPFTGGVSYEIVLIADGRGAFVVNNRDLTQSNVATFGRSSCGEFLLELTPDSEAKYLMMNVRIPIDFRANLALYFRQRTGAALSVTGRLFANVLR